MKTKKNNTRILYFLFSTLFFFGIQLNADAQIRVINNTGCNVAVIVAQTTNGTCAPCNQSAFTLIPPGGLFIHPALDACGGPPEFWEVVRYFVGPDFGIPPIISFGQTFNPGLGGACGVDVAGVCSGAITATWFGFLPGGGGPQTVVLQ